MKKEEFKNKLEGALIDAIKAKGKMSEMKERFKKLEEERRSILRKPPVSQTDVILTWARKAAFMHNEPLSTSSLPISDETIKNFLNTEGDEEKNAKKR